MQRTLSVDSCQMLHECTIARKVSLKRLAVGQCHFLLIFVSCKMLSILGRHTSLILWLCVQSSQCGQICEAVAKATEYFPPQLAGPQGRGHDDSSVGRAGPQLAGTWASRRCETRPYGVQLTRHYQFWDMDNTWSSRHNYFSDVSCRHSLYSLDVSGVFTLHQEPSPILDGAHHIDFNVSNQNTAIGLFRPTSLHSPAFSCGNRRPL